MNKYYSPQIERDLVSVLYHEAKARDIPMTKLASQLLRAALRHEGIHRARQTDGATHWDDTAPLKVELRYARREADVQKQESAICDHLLDNLYSFSGRRDHVF